MSKIKVFLKNLFWAILTLIAFITLIIEILLIGNAYNIPM